MSTVSSPTTPGPFPSFDVSGAYSCAIDQSGAADVLSRA